ncbi:MAG: hypothetical protein FJ125_08295 [Deltaproteobacteria bacterium]|nr:hypothetical protein [Deltaproteobacteria bacterium]
MTTKITPEAARAAFAKAAADLQDAELALELAQAREAAADYRPRRTGPPITGYTATQWATAEDKERWFLSFWKFLLAGAKPERFSDAHYKRLTCMFGHIAHYDKAGFSAEWFSTPRRRVNWVLLALTHPLYGSPEWTWVDVELKLQASLAANIEAILAALTR